MDNTEEFRCISLCTGYGGIELGLRNCIPNLRTVVYVEVEAFACANLVAKIEEGKMDAAPIWTDIKTFNGRPFRNRVHIITGGYPCQPFSVAGQRKGEKDERHLWPYIEGVVKAVRPVWCFFENVSGHLTIGFPSVYRSLRNLGYSVEAGLFTASECGAPHKRERLFILGYSATVRPCGISEDSQKTTTNKDGKECRLHESSGASTLSEHESQQETISNSEPDRRREICSKGHKYSTQQEHDSTCEKGRVRWPARPNERQYEWEKSRVVKSRLDGTTDGVARWVDRLRLLGNGVVPQCAELAFRTLIEKFK